MKVGGLYPINKTEDYIGPLPYSLEHGVNETIRWMKNNGEIK